MCIRDRQIPPQQPQGAAVLQAPQQEHAEKGGKKEIQEEENKIPVINPKLHGPVRSPELVANESITLSLHINVKKG